MSPGPAADPNRRPETHTVAMNLAAFLQRLPGTASPTALARRLGVSELSIRRWLKTSRLPRTVALALLAYYEPTRNPRTEVMDPQPVRGRTPVPVRLDAPVLEYLRRHNALDLIGLTNETAPESPYKVALRKTAKRAVVPPPAAEPPAPAPAAVPAPTPTPVDVPLTVQLDALVVVAARLAGDRNSLAVEIDRTRRIVAERDTTIRQQAERIKHLETEVREWQQLAESGERPVGQQINGDVLNGLVDLLTRTVTERGRPDLAKELERLRGK